MLIIQVASSQMFIVTIVEKGRTASTIREEDKILDLDELLPDDIEELLSQCIFTWNGKGAGFYLWCRKLKDVLCEGPQNHLRCHVMAIITPQMISLNLKSHFTKLIKAKCQPEFNIFTSCYHLPRVTECKWNTIRILQILQENESPMTTLFS